jgi:hypothetical protein
MRINLIICGHWPSWPYLLLLLLLLLLLYIYRASMAIGLYRAYMGFWPKSVSRLARNTHDVDFKRIFEAMPWNSKNRRLGQEEKVDRTERGRVRWKP